MNEGLHLMGVFECKASQTGIYVWTNPAQDGQNYKNAQTGGVGKSKNDKINQNHFELKFWAI